MNKEFLPYDISEDGHFGKLKTGFPDGLPQETVVYFPNGYIEPMERENTTGREGEDNHANDVE